MELLSIVIYLDAKSDREMPTDSGPLVQGWFFKTLRAQNEALGVDIHKKGGYSLSGIMGDENGMYIRITSMRADLSELLYGTLLPALQKQSFALDTATFGVKMTLTGDHKLAGRASYAGLRTQTTPSSSLSLNFASPTAFRTGGMDLPLPLPYHVILSWWKAWNKFAPEIERIGYPLHLFAENCIAIKELQNIKTEEAPLPKNNHATGFSGQVTCTLQPIKKCEEWSSLWASARHDWQTLANFALFAGTGQHTGCGMGQTHPGTASSN